MKHQDMSEYPVHREYAAGLTTNFTNLVLKRKARFLGGVVAPTFFSFNALGDALPVSKRMLALREYGQTGEEKAPGRKLAHLLYRRNKLRHARTTNRATECKGT